MMTEDGLYVLSPNPAYDVVGASMLFSSGFSEVQVLRFTKHQISRVSE